MPHSLRIRRGQSQDASLLAVLAAQVWLHTYATEGITSDIANYVLSEFTPARFLSLMNDPACRLFVAEDGQNLVGLAVVKFGVSCPGGNSSTTELQTLYVQEHFVGRGVGKSLLQAVEAEAREQSNVPPMANGQRRELQGYRILRASRLFQGRHGILCRGRGAS